MPYKTIVLAYDGTAEGRRALLEGAELAKRCQADVHLLAVIADSTGGAMAQGVGAEPMQRTVFFRATVEDGVKFFKSLGLDAKSHVVHGEPVEEIVKLAEEVNADLVVVGHRERGALARWWSTPTSMSLLDKLSCSLLIGMRETGPGGGN
jgi:nucleotide-binding universal stress UspA family protein